MWPRVLFGAPRVVLRVVYVWSTCGRVVVWSCGHEWFYVWFYVWSRVVTFWAFRVPRKGHVCCENPKSSTVRIYRSIWGPVPCRAPDHYSYTPVAAIPATSPYSAVLVTYTQSIIHCGLRVLRIACERITINYCRVMAAMRMSLIGTVRTRV